jgi:hypothetical protein
LLMRRQISEGGGAAHQKKGCKQERQKFIRHGFGAWQSVPGL